MLTYANSVCVITGTDDEVTAIAFDHTGALLAAGDHLGRVIVWNAEEKGNGSLPADYKLYCEFQSHHADFDALKSVEISETIKQIEWLRRPSGAVGFLLITNDKTIKLWKVYEVDVRMPVETFSVSSHASRAPVVPRLALVSRDRYVRNKRTYERAHNYHINAISACSDGETFLSADDMSINVWDIETTCQTCNILDITPKPEDQDPGLTEVLTTAVFHPQHCNYLIYGTSAGVATLCDLRQALNQSGLGVAFSTAGREDYSIFSRVVSSISDVQWAPDGVKFLVRDFMTVKVWDARQNRQPLLELPIHDHLLLPHMEAIYETDTVFDDRFRCQWSHDGRHIVTGSYHNSFHVFDTTIAGGNFGSTSEGGAAGRLGGIAREGRGGGHVCIEPMIQQSTGRRKKYKPGRRGSGSGSPAGVGGSAPGVVEGGSLDTSRKGLNVAWHPSAPVITLCTITNIFIYTGHTDSSTSSPTGAAAASTRDGADEGMGSRTAGGQRSRVGVDFAKDGGGGGSDSAEGYF